MSFTNQQIWQNAESVTDQALNQTNEYLTKLNAGIVVLASYGKYGRVVWEIKAKPAAPAQPA